MAVDAMKVGKEFEQKVTSMEQLADDTPDLDKMAGGCRKDLDAAVMSAPLKIELRGRIEGIQKKASDATKKALQKRIDLCLNEVKKVVAASTDKEVLVMNVDIGADSKASQSVLNTVKAMAPKIAFLGITEEIPGSGGKVMVFASVPDTIIDTTGLKADEWVRTALESCNGRGGGKPTNAQGQAKECSDINTIIDAATKFAELVRK
jgi:alanyl-tRNA synthetase